MLDPEFEILRAVVVADAVLVVDVLSRQKLPSKFLFHDETMFKNIGLLRTRLLPERDTCNAHSLGRLWIPKPHVTANNATTAIPAATVFSLKFLWVGFI